MVKLAKKFLAKYMKTVPLLVENLNQEVSFVKKPVSNFLLAQPNKPYFGGSAEGSTGGGTDVVSPLVGLSEKSMQMQSAQMDKQRQWEAQQALLANRFQARQSRKAIKQQKRSDATAAALQTQQQQYELAQQAKEEAARQTALLEAQQQTKDAAARKTANAAAQAAGQQASGNITPSAIAATKMAEANQSAPGLTPFSAALATTNKVGNQFYAPGNVRFGGG